MKNMICICAVLVLAGCTASGKEKENSFSVKDQAETLDSLSRSVVVVNYTFKYDKGNAPEGVYTSYICPNCGGRHTSNDGRKALREERPLERQGYLIDDKTVVTADLKVPPRFLKSLQVCFKGQTVAAEIASYAQREKAVFLHLEKPLKGSKPLQFEPRSSAPFFAAHFSSEKASWGGTLTPLSMLVTVNDMSTSIKSLQSDSVIVNMKGEPVALTFNGELPLDDSWKGSPRQWPVIKADKMKKMREDLKQYTAAVLPMAQIKLRSPDIGNGSHSRYERYYGGDDLSGATEIHALALVVDKRRVWILKALPAEITARIENIYIFKADGTKSQATFTCSLRDYGILVAETDETFARTMELADTDIRTIFNQVVLNADVQMTGKDRIAYALHDRIVSAERGWRNEIYPSSGSIDAGNFIFDVKNRLLILPVSMRRDNLQEDYYRDSEIIPMQGAQVKRLMAHVPDLVDPNNIPLSEEEAARIAWMGVELQEMNAELARANNVAEQTDDGETGALVNYVFPDSPAAKAGVKPGMILLRLLVKDNPRPVKIKIDTEDEGRYEQIMLDPRLDNAPVEYLNQMPPPWKNLENDFTKLVTKIGFDKAYTAEFFYQGNVIRKPFMVEKSPVHYGAATRKNNKILGVTVKPLTFEVRRYLKKTAESPGVIVCKVETGSKADIAGLKPYEVITTVNKQSVKGLEEFNEMIKKDSELVLTVERLNKTRQVRIAPEKE